MCILCMQPQLVYIYTYRNKHSQHTQGYNKTNNKLHNHCSIKQSPSYMYLPCCASPTRTTILLCTMTYAVISSTVWNIENDINQRHTKVDIMICAVQIDVSGFKNTFQLEGFITNDSLHSHFCMLWHARSSLQCHMANKTRQSVAVQREGGIPVGKKILHPYQNP